MSSDSVAQLPCRFLLTSDAQCALEPLIRLGYPAESVHDQWEISGVTFATTPSPCIIVAYYSNMASLTRFSVFNNNLSDEHPAPTLLGSFSIPELVGLTCLFRSTPSSAAELPASSDLLIICLLKHQFVYLAARVDTILSRLSSSTVSDRLFTPLFASEHPPRCVAANPANGDLVVCEIVEEQFAVSVQCLQCDTASWIHALLEPPADYRSRLDPPYPGPHSFTGWLGVPPPSSESSESVAPPPAVAAAQYVAERCESVAFSDDGELLFVGDATRIAVFRLSHSKDSGAPSDYKVEYDWNFEKIPQDLPISPRYQLLSVIPSPHHVARLCPVPHSPQVAVVLSIELTSRSVVDAAAMLTYSFLDASPSDSHLTTAAAEGKFEWRLSPHVHLEHSPSRYSRETIHPFASIDPTSRLLCIDHFKGAIPLYQRVALYNLDDLAARISDAT